MWVIECWGKADLDHWGYLSIDYVQAFERTFDRVTARKFSLPADANVAAEDLGSRFDAFEFRVVPFEA